MYNTIAIKTDYSLLKSLIKVSDIINFSKTNNIPFLGILDDNLFGSIEFYDNCINNNIKPLIGLDIIIDSLHYYLYALDYTGYKSLLKINTLVQKNELNLETLKEYTNNLILVIPFSSKASINEYKDIFKDVYISYENEYKYKSALILTKNVIPLSITNTLEDNDYINILDKIRDDNEKTNICKIRQINSNDYNILLKFVDKINIEIDKTKRYIPKFRDDVDSFDLLYSLCKKGLNKRLNNNVSKEYIDRLNYELNVIKNMGFVDYFLIVYDYVKYAKTHDIMVGPGRGSAAGSLVSYTLGITNIDPVKYNLLFERFLNPDRVTMPDIDVDFDASLRDKVIDYVKSRYNSSRVAQVMTYATLASRQVLKDVAKSLNLNNNIDYLTKVIDQKLSLKDNLNIDSVKRILTIYPELKEVYNISLKLEGLKRQISTTAAGVVICSQDLDNLIPICINDNNILAGLTLNYLEELGILKMDFLGISNLTIIHDVLSLINNEININDISLEDTKVYDMFMTAETTGIFQFESSGMRSFLKKLQPKTFSDLYAALALFRPGPMDNIDTFIKRKNGLEKIDYIDDSLKDILYETYGIIIYQEQIMQILVKMASYTYAEADNIRRAMSKKKEKIIAAEKDHFIISSINNGYKREVAEKVYEMILKFANYGFNKSHSVSYALIGYQMAYLKVHYTNYYIGNLLNMVVGNEAKSKEYLDMAKQYNIYILKPDINLSIKGYKIGKNKLRLPLSIIKNVGEITESIILEIREQKEFSDFFDFVGRTYSKSVTKRVIEYLIISGALDSFKVNRKTLMNNIDNAIRYAELLSNLDSSLIEKPLLEEVNEYSERELMEQELNAYGFYITNHPASKFVSKDIVKLSKVSEFFDKFIKCVVIINKMRFIKTKKGDNMCFINASDETSTCSFVCFPSSINLIKDIKENDLVEIVGRVARRYSEYQINISKINKL